MVKSNKIKAFWILFLSLVALCAIASGVYYYITLNDELSRQKSTMITDENFYKMRLENQYQQSLYSVSESMLSINSSLDKVLVCNDKAIQQELLTDVAIQSNNINVCVSALPLLSSDNSVALEQISNKITQFSLALSRHLASGQSLSDNDIMSLRKISNAINSLYDTVRELMTSDSGMYITNSMFADGANVINNAVDSIDCKVFDIGELNYDGLYADSNLQEIIPKTKVTITAEQGKDNVQNFVSQFAEVKEVKYNYAITNGGMIYAYTVTTADGQADVLLTSNGYIAEFDYNYTQNDSQDESLTLKDCYDIGEQFAKKFDERMTAVWVRQSDGDIAYVHVVPEHNGVLIYPEYIKIAVNTKTGKVEGMQAHKYASHTLEYNNVKIGEYDYQAITDKFYDGVNITNVKYAYMQKCCQYYTCYQLQIEKDDEIFFAFVDTNSGKIVDIYKMVASNVEGATIM